MQTGFKRDKVPLPLGEIFNVDSAEFFINIESVFKSWRRYLPNSRRLKGLWSSFRVINIPGASMFAKLLSSDSLNIT